MSENQNRSLINQVLKLGREPALEIARTVLDYFGVDLKGTDYIDDLVEIGLDYDRYGEPDKALKIYLKAERRASVIGDQHGLGTIYSNIGTIYNNTQEYNKAMEYYQKALEIIKNSNDDQELGILYNNLGYVYKNIMKYVESVEYYLKSLKHLHKANDKFSMTASYYNLAEVFAKIGDFDGAIEYMDECIKIDKELNLSTLKSDIKYKEQLIAKKNKKESAEPAKTISNKKPEDLNNQESKELEKEPVSDKKRGWFWGKK